ncbi:cubilin homolog [Drosophila innubila]|uniref:cubilin homolog n=1 Tax=Drosophila innubila TaxID=198719 RepID=UPI00148E09ED|nr:cubilin homolog [Drosophila innubila]
MCKNIYWIKTTIYCGLLFLLQLPEATASNPSAQALLHGGDDGTLCFEAAKDQNITFRLMGDAATLLLNGMDIVPLLQRRQRAVAAAAQSTDIEREPLSLDALKEQFRGVQRDLSRLSRGLINMHNGTRRGRLTQRLLRRTLQRVQIVGNTLETLEANLRKDECTSNPCKNGGTCLDAYKAFQCNCPAGWQGVTCEDDVNECFDLASTDLAVCMNDAQCINTPGSYRCVCRKGYSGTHCRLHQNACLANQSAELCGSHGTCLTSSNDAGFVCICDQGWTWADTNVSMASPSPCTRDVDECAPDINPCHNECINLPGSFRCGACPPGYTGDGKFCRDLDECADGNNGGCSQRPTVNCINTEGSYRCGRCPVGWTGDGHTCEEAKSNSCNGEKICHPSANCEYISDTIVCSCPAGYFGHGYGSDGCTEDANRKPCDNHPCLNNGTCVLSGRGTSCICQPGYMGALCGETDACHPNPCQNGGTCRLLPGNKFMCVCAAGYSGSTCSNLRSFCGLILRNETGSMQFPSSQDITPTEYQPSERCPFIIATRPGMILNVTFGLFDLESSNECTADFLQIHDGSSLTARLIGRFCGNKLPLGNGTVLTTQEQMFLWFLSNNATQGRGFNLTWTSMPMVCGGELNLKLGQSGVLRSPSYPGKTRPGIDCRWHLEAPFGTRLLLHFYEITLGLANSPTTPPVNCSNGDYLKVLDSDRQLYLACQSAQPEPVYSSSHKLNIHFHTDLFRMDSSFQLHYEVIAGHPSCGGIFTEPRGLIRGHTNDHVCLYLIQQPNGTKIELNFQKLRLLFTGNCRLQQLQVFDGGSEDQPQLRRFCGQPEDSELQPFMSSGNVVLMRYDYALHGFDLPTNFELRYSRVCNANFSGDQGGIITTPNYPNGYYENMDCTFNIIGPLNTKVKINITDLSLSGTEPSLVQPDDDDSTINVGSQLNYLDVSTNNKLRLVFHGTNNPHRARGLRLEYEFIRSGCGGVLTSPNTTVHRFLNYPCQWIIEVPGRKHLVVSMRSFTRLAAEIYIYDNITAGEAKLLRRVQLSNDIRNFKMNEYTDSSLLTINVPTSSMYVIDIRYEPANEVCGGNFTSRYGTIKSPNWPENYGSRENCTWIITVPLGERIELIVHKFTVETTSEECHDDYLEIRNGDHIGAPLIGRYCGYSIPPRIPSFGNALYVHFHSDHVIEEQGFYLNWQMAASGCGGKLTSPVGAIHSPHSMAGNRGALSCDWQISVSLGSTVQMQLQSRDNLCNGLLSIHDGPTTRSPKLSLNCSSGEEPLEKMLTLSSSGNQVLVRYDVGTNSPDGIGFVLDYSTNCWVRLEQLHGTIETPNFPENYPPDIRCTWDIRGGQGSNRIQLAFSHMTMENNDARCDYDYVLLRDYRDNQLISEQRLCDLKDEIISSVGNRLVVKFNSDYTIVAQGFHAEYKRLGCGEEFLNEEGQFETPNAPYSVDLDCHWRIVVPEGKRIRLVFKDLHIETTQRDCSQDSLTVWAGSNSSEALLRSCQVESSIQTLISPTNEINVRFRSSSQRARKYLNVTYDSIAAECGGYLSASNGIIASPSYYQPGLDVYYKDVECVWTIEVLDSYGIKLEYQTFNLTGKCDESELKIFDFGTENVKRQAQYECGADPYDLVFLTKKLQLRFKVKAGSWGKFAMRYKRICGGLRIADEGYLNSRLDSNCYWIIQGAEGSKISLNINQLECPACTAPAGNCTAGLRVLNEDSAVTYYNLCREHPANLMIPSNKARIEAVGIVLSAQYTTIDNSCGGNITSARGTLSSPNYPESYPSNVECDWLITPRAGNAIELNFEAMDIAKSEHCNVDFLEVRADRLGPLLGLYCDNILPAEPIVSTTNIWLKFRTLPGSSGNGFKLRWNYVHDVELINRTSGTIESPPTLTVRGDEQPYSWRIYPPSDSVVVLDFKEYLSGLQLFDGFDDTGLSIDIENSPWQFISSSNVLYLKTVNTDFVSFRLEWKIMKSDKLTKNVTLTEECNKIHIVDKDTAIEVTSPGYPHGYRSRLNCEWTFKPSDVAHHVFVDLYEAQLEDSEQCSFDYLSIQSSSNLASWQEQLRVCNKSADPLDNPLQRVHGTPNLKLKFYTDISMNGTGFRAIVNTKCGSNMTDSVGTIISSSVLPSTTVGESSFCEWHIDVRPNRVIDISIEYNGQPINKNCTHFGIIYDGVDIGAPMLPHGKFCNQLNLNTGSYRTSGPHATIRYFMPALFAKANPPQNNWTLTYREFRDCNTEIRLTHLAPSYVFSTPGYPDSPHAHTDCTWLVVAPLGESIAANFVDAFDLSTRDCDKEFVELYDGSTMLSRRLLQSCRRPDTQRTSANFLLVHYQTELNEPHSGFTLNVSLSQCGGQQPSSGGFITSEHYPAYPKPAACEYTIKTLHSSHYVVNITDLHLPYNANAKADDLDRIEFLDLMDQRRIMLVLYGNMTQLPYTDSLQTSEVAIRFVATSANVNSYRGFKLEYKSELGSCDRSINAASGELNIQKSVVPLRGMRNCVWRIFVPKGQRVRLEFLNLEDLRAPSTVHLPHRVPFGISPRQQFTAYNDIFHMAKIIDFNLNLYNGSGIIESSDNYMGVRIILSPSMAQKTLRARFSSNEPSACPPDIGGQAAGMLSNQELINLPSYYCTIKFVAEPGVTISFNTQYSSYTQIWGYVRFKDDVQGGEQLLLTTGNVTFSVATTSGHLVIYQSELSAQLHFRATYQRYACGGHIKLTEGMTIEIPRLTEHFGILDCMWRLDNSEGYELMINSSFSDSCDNENLVISNVNTEVARFCRGMTQNNNTTLKHKAYHVRYHATQYHSGSSEFQLLATKPDTANGDIVRVGYSPEPAVTVDAKRYKNNMELTWEFRASQFRTLRLKFQNRFFIEMAPNCSNDRLEVLSYQSDIWQPIATFCGRDLPQPLHVHSNRMRLIFRTNGNVTGDGFTFVVLSTCDVKRQATHDLQTILSGRDIARRLRGETVCNYEFTTDTEHQVLVMVKGIHNTKWSQITCQYFAYFEAYRRVEGDTQQEQLINNRLCPIFEASGYGAVHLVHKIADRSIPFEIQYQLIGCGGNHTAPFILRPPLSESGSSYKHGVECLWHVVAPPQHAIFLHFKYFELDTQYQMDELNVYRGSSPREEQRVSRLRGNLSTPFIMIDSNEALIVANLPGYSDENRRGFLASVSFTPNCNERLALSEGNNRMSLVRHFQMNDTNSTEDLHCYFRASAPPGYRLSISLKQLHLNGPHCRNCNSLEVVDGFDMESPSLGTYYANVDNGTKLLSSANDVIIKVSGKKPSQSISFELMLQMEATICGQVEYTLSGNQTVNLRLSSNNTSSNYEGNIHCKWHFISDKSVTIYMHAVQLQDVSQLTRKCNDYLLIKGEYSGPKIYCGQFSNNSLDLTVINGFDVTFHSNGGETTYALDITVGIQKYCNRTHTALDGSIYYYAIENDDLKNCINEIHVPHGFAVAMELEFVQFERGENASYLNITDLGANRTLLNATDNFESSPISILSTSNKIRIAASGVRYIQIYYHSNINTLPTGCGGQLTSLEGYFANPPYESREYSECTWQIAVPAGITLKFNFRSFDMGPSSNCALDNVKIYELLADNSESLRHTFCGHEMPEDFTVNSNRLKVVSKKSPNFVGTGFRVYYNQIYEQM